MKRAAIVAIVVFSALASDTFSQTLFRTYTGLSGFYDYQVNGRTPQYIRMNPANGHLHSIYMASSDSPAVTGDPSRGTLYAYSNNGGLSWNTFGNIRIPERRSGFPALDLGQGHLPGAALIANHSIVTIGAPQSTIFIDYPEGGGAFSEIAPPVGFGSDEALWPDVAGASNGNAIIAGSRTVAGTLCISNSGNSTWTNPICYPNLLTHFQVEANTTNRVGLVAMPGIQWIESLDTGNTWPAQPTQLLPPQIVFGPDTFAITYGLDLVYSGNEPLVTFGVTKLIAGVPSHRHSGIGFWRSSTGFVLAVPHESIPSAIDTMGRTQVNHVPVGYPAIGLSGSAVVIGFQAFRAETSAAGFNYSDVFFIASTNGGVHWSAPVNISNTPFLDERYPAMSKWNAAGQANMVWQEDTQPGSSVLSDLSPIARVRQVFCRMSDFLTGLNEMNEPAPMTFSLSQNYPNPFNPTTNIKFQIPGTSFVTLKVFDVLGKEVATLVNEVRTPGEHSVTWDAGNASSGVYYYRLTAGSSVMTRTMLLIR